MSRDNYPVSDCRSGPPNHLISCRSSPLVHPTLGARSLPVLPGAESAEVCILICLFVLASDSESVPARLKPLPPESKEIGSPNMLTLLLPPSSRDGGTGRRSGLKSKIVLAFRVH
jgi:hypothetical protein